MNPFLNWFPEVMLVLSIIVTLFGLMWTAYGVAEFYFDEARARRIRDTKRRLC